MSLNPAFDPVAELVPTIPPPATSTPPTVGLHYTFNGTAAVPLTDYPQYYPPNTVYTFGSGK